MNETYYHSAEILILLLGVALPMWRSSQRLRSILQDFPPHRHVNGKIIFPKGYRPEEEVITRG